MSISTRPGLPAAGACHRGSAIARLPGRRRSAGVARLVGVAIRGLLALSILATLATLASCENAGRGALAELHHTVQDTLVALPGLVRQLDDLTGRTLGHGDAILQRNIAAAGEVVHAEIDVLNGVLGARIDQVGAITRDRIDQLDLALSARITQLGTLTAGLVGELQGVLSGTIKELTYSGDELIARLNQSGVDVVEHAGFTVSRTFEAGGKVIAVITRSLLDGAIVIAAAALLITLALLGFLFFRALAQRPTTRPAQWAPVTAILLAGAGLAVAGLVPSVRHAIAGSEVTMGDAAARRCPDAVVQARGFLAAGGQGPPPRATVELELYRCLASSGTSELRSEARRLLAQLRTTPDPRCRSNDDCDAAKGERCDLAASLCTSRCTADAQCPAGKVCDATGTCIAPCVTYADCARGQICQSGHCALAAECSPGDTRSCGSSARAPCRLGSASCDDGGRWGACVGNLEPKPVDVCVDGDDSSCDGVTANGFAAGNRGVCLCLIGSSPPCDCTGKCAGLQGTRSCEGEGHALGACSCSCDCTPGSIEAVACDNGCAGARTCDGAGHWGGRQCPAQQCPAGFSPRGDACVWSGGQVAEFNWSVTGTPDHSVFQTLEPPPECSVTGAACTFVFSVRDNRGDCRADGERALEVRCAGSGATLTLTAGDIRNEQIWRMDCNGTVTFKKLTSAYYWGFKGCMRNVGEPRGWEAVTSNKRCP